MSTEERVCLQKVMTQCIRVTRKCESLQREMIELKQFVFDYCSPNESKGKKGKVISVDFRKTRPIEEM